MSSFPPLKKCCFLTIFRCRHAVKTPPKICLVFIAPIQEFQRDVATGKYTCFLPTGCCFSQQPTGRSHRYIFSLMPFIFAKRNMVIQWLLHSLLGSMTLAPDALNALEFGSHDIPYFSFLDFIHFLLLSDLPPVDGNVLFRVTALVTDLLLLSTLHTTVLLELNVWQNPGVVCPCDQNSPGQLTCTYVHSLLGFLCDWATASSLGDFILLLTLTCGNH